jgi:phosphoglycolate phosphatase
VSLLIFDLDGTLIDSKRDLVVSVNAVRAYMGFGPLTDGIIASYVGDGAPALVRRALPDIADADQPRALRYFLDYYREHMLDATTVYPGVREALDRLHDAHVAMAVLTNKPVRFSVSLLEGLDLDRHFFRIYGGNSFAEKKPHPAGVEALLIESGADRSRTFVIGDSWVDVATARNAAVRSCGVTWGFQPETFAHTAPDRLIHHPDELAELVVC